MNKPINVKELSGWDGHSAAGQAAYDRHFEFEKDHSAIIDVIDNQMDYDPEEVAAAYAALQKYK